MRLPNDFEFYIKQAIIRKQSPDRSRAQFLISESETSFQGLRKRVEVMGINKFNANSIIKDAYDIIMELIRAKLLLEGYSAAGNYAHEAEISYLKKLGFPENKLRFLNQLRYFRNSINYYGKILDEQYAKQVFEFLNQNHKKIKATLRIT